MSDISIRNLVILAWHGVDGDTATYSAQIGPYTGKDAAQVSSHQTVDARAFAAPAMDPTAEVLATVGLTSPSPIRLRPVPKQSWTGGPAVPETFVTDARPAVAVTSARRPVLAWRRPADSVICVAAYNGSKWSSPIALGRSDHGPAAAVNSDNRYLVVFQSPASNQIMGSLSGAAPVAMRPVAGAMLTGGIPALCWGAGNYWMAWKGVPGDEHIWLAKSSDGLHWTAPAAAIPSDGGIFTISGPGLAVWGRGLVLCWRGVTGDQALWWSTHPLASKLESGWQIPRKLNAAHNSNAGPTMGSHSALMP